MNWRATLAVWLLLTWTTAGAADDFKVIKLEQDVRNLERQVNDLSRQLADLRQRSSRAGDNTVALAPAAPATGDPLMWVNAQSWKRVRAGMTELEVISLLGPPTSLRGGDQGVRTLMYAMEIGSSGFLSGSIQLEDRKVVEVQIPTLK